MRDVLRREDYWINKRAEKIPLPDIDQDYAATIVNFLNRRAKMLLAGELGEYIGWPWAARRATPSAQPPSQSAFRAPSATLRCRLGTDMYRLLKNLAS